MRVPILLLLVAALLLPAALPAQTNYTVSPGAFTTVAGNTHNPFPFYPTTFSYAQVHDDLGGMVKRITAIAFRREETMAGTYPSCVVNLTLRISNAKTTSATPSSSYAANHGSNLTEVLTKANVNFPSTVKPTTPTAPFAYVVPFPTKPFVYAPIGSLCWEMRVHSIQQTIYMDFVDSRSGDKQYGKGCRATGQTNDAWIVGMVTSIQSPPRTWKFYQSAYNLGPSQPYVWMIGADDKMWGSTPLPLDLTPFGGSGCSIYTAPIIMIGGTTDSTGYVNGYNNAVNTPHNPTLWGVPLYIQTFSADPGNPALPLVFTNGCKVTMPTFTPPVCRIYKRGSDTVTSGSVNLTCGLVTRFSYM